MKIFAKIEYLNEFMRSTWNRVENGPFGAGDSPMEKVVQLEQPGHPVGHVGKGTKIPTEFQVIWFTRFFQLCHDKTKKDVRTPNTKKFLKTKEG